MKRRTLVHVYVASPDRSAGFEAAVIDERASSAAVVEALTPEGWSAHVDPDWAYPPLFNLVGWTDELGRDPITRWERDHGA